MGSSWEARHAGKDAASHTTHGRICSPACVLRKIARSEERRVGKEGRSLCDWSSDVCSSDLFSGRGEPWRVGLGRPPDDNTCTQSSASSAACDCSVWALPGKPDTPAKMQQAIPPTVESAVLPVCFVK